MRKIAVIVVLALTLLLMGLTLSASALTINNAPSGEESLYLVFNHILGTTLGSNAALLSTYTTILETLPTVGMGGTYPYSLTGGYATFSGFTQDPGTNPTNSPTTTLLGAPFPTTSGANNYFTLGSPINLAPTTDGSGNFGFADYYTGSSTGTKYTQLSLNSGSPSQSNGLIFQVSATQFIVAFEDGDGTQPLGNLGNKDYNDLVINVTQTFQFVPLPPTLLLLGSGVLGLVSLRKFRKN